MSLRGSGREEGMRAIGSVPVSPESTYARMRFANNANTAIQTQRKKKKIKKDLTLISLF